MKKTVKGDSVFSMRPPRPIPASSSESVSRLASTSKRATTSSSPSMALHFESSAPKTPPNGNLALVLPVEGSPTGSLHAGSDFDMDETMQEVEEIQSQCNRIREICRIRSCSSDRNIGKIRSNRALPPVDSNERLEKIRNRSTSGQSRHRALPEHENDLVTGQSELQRPAIKLHSARKRPLGDLNFQPSSNLAASILPKVFRKRTVSPATTVSKENRLRVTRVLHGLP